jgi:hypothetical protein
VGLCTDAKSCGVALLLGALKMLMPVSHSDRVIACKQMQQKAAVDVMQRERCQASVAEFVQKSDILHRGCRLIPALSWFLTVRRCGLKGQMYKVSTSDYNQ